MLSLLSSEPRIGYSAAEFHLFRDLTCRLRHSLAKRRERVGTRRKTCQDLQGHPSTRKADRRCEVG